MVAPHEVAESECCRGVQKQSGAAPQSALEYVERPNCLEYAFTKESLDRPDRPAVPGRMASR